MSTLSSFARQLLENSAVANAQANAGANPAAVPGTLQGDAAKFLAQNSPPAAPPPSNPAAVNSAAAEAAQNPNAEKAQFLGQLAQPPPGAPANAQQAVPAGAADEAALAKLSGQNLPNNLITDAPTLNVEAARTRDEGLKESEKENARNVAVAREEQGLLEKQAQKAQPILDNLANEQKDSQERLKTAADEVQKQQETQMANYQSVQQEMMQMAAAKPQDLFGQAGVNKIAGCIAIFLGGAGTNGNGPNRSLEMIQNMATRHMEEQKNKFEMLNRIGQGNQTMYGMLTSKLQNKTAVEAAFQNSALAATNAQLKASANSFGGPQAKLEADKLVAASNNKMAENNIRVKQSYQGTAANTLQFVATQQLARIKTAQELAKIQLDQAQFGLSVHKQDYLEKQNAEKEKQNEIDGFIGTVKPIEHAKLSEIAGGARNIVEMLGKLDKMLDAPLTPESLNAIDVYQNVIKGAARGYFQTGTKLENEEVKQLAAVTQSKLDLISTMLQHSKGQMLTNGDVLELRKRIENTRGIITAGAYRNIKTHAPHVSFNPQDDVWGQYDPNTWKGGWEQAAQEEAGTQSGRKALLNYPVRQ